MNVNITRRSSRAVKGIQHREYAGTFFRVPLSSQHNNPRQVPLFGVAASSLDNGEEEVMVYFGVRGSLITALNLVFAVAAPTSTLPAATTGTDCGKDNRGERSALDTVSIVRACQKSGVE